MVDGRAAVKEFLALGFYLEVSRYIPRYLAPGRHPPHGEDLAGLSVVHNKSCPSLLTIQNFQVSLKDSPANGRTVFVSLPWKV